MYRSTMNTNVITALGMCKVCTEAIHSVSRKRQDWTCESTCEHENAKTRKYRKCENGRNQPVDAKTAKTRKRRKRENGENKKTAKTGKTRKRRKPENAKTTKTAKSVPVFWFSISRFLVFSVFWFSRFLVFSFRWPHPSGQVAFFMCLEKWWALENVSPASNMASFGISMFDFRGVSQQFAPMEFEYFCSYPTTSQPPCLEEIEPGSLDP